MVSKSFFPGGDRPPPGKALTHTHTRTQVPRQGAEHKHPHTRILPSREPPLGRTAGWIGQFMQL